MKWGGTHRFNDAAAVEAKHRVSLKKNGEKVRFRTDTQTEKDLLRVTQEELVYEILEERLDDMSSEDPVVTVTDEIAAYNAQQNPNSDPECEDAITLTVPLHANIRVYDDQREHLVHREVLLSWGELLDKFDHCFPSVKGLHEEVLWGVYQHALHEVQHDSYHYWGTDTGYPAISLGGIRRRRDMIHVSLGGEHLAEIVCFVMARLPTSSTSDLSPQDTTKKNEVNEFYLTIFTWVNYLVILPEHGYLTLIPEELTWRHNLYTRSSARSSAG